MDYQKLDPEVRGGLEALAAKQGFKKPGFILDSGSKKGDNFMGVMHRVKVTETDDDSRKSPLSLIVKCQPASEERRKWLRTPVLFSNEAAFYNEIIPAFINFQKEKGIITSDMSPSHVRCFRAGEMIVMEDQIPLGFTMRARQEPLDLTHCLVILRELGRMHAMSFALRDQKPALFQRLTATIQEALFLKGENQPMVEWQRGSIRTSLTKFKELATVENKSKYSEALERLSDDYIANMIDLVNGKSAEPYAVINHGDCWTNNILFKYKQDGNLEKLCLLDFQIARLASPACDITFFLFCCTDKATRDAHHKQMLQEYHSSLATHLAKLGSDVEKLFPMKALENQLRRSGKYGMALSVCLLPMFTCNPEDMKDSDTSHDGGAETLGKSFNFDHINDKKFWQRIFDIIIDAFDYGYLK